MALKQIFKISRRTFFNPLGWIGYDTLSASSQTVFGMLKATFSPPAAQHTETFESAMTRLKLTEADIQATAKKYLMFVIIFVGFGVFAFLASFYFLFYHATLAGWMLAMASAALFFVQAFRYHFWFFQIKHRKLGCTFEEWRRGKTNPPRDPQS